MMLALQVTSVTLHCACPPVTADCNGFAFCLHNNCADSLAAAHTYVRTSALGSSQCCRSATCMAIGRVVPWISWAEWSTVHRGLFAADSAQQKAALRQVGRHQQLKPACLFDSWVKSGTFCADSTLEVQRQSAFGSGCHKLLDRDRHQVCLNSLGNSAASMHWCL